MPAASAQRGRFVWHELTTTDPDAAARFYPSVTRWKVQDWEHNPNYRLWVTDAGPMGGLMRLPDEERRRGAPPYWLTYVWAADVDALVRQATSLGGRVLKAPETIPVGRFAVLADPQGATFAVYRPSMGPGGPTEPGVGDFSWHELATTDYKAAWEFYRTLFGWEYVSSMDMGPAGVYWMFGYAGQKRPIGGIYNKGPEKAGPPAWLPYVRVVDADRAAATAGRSGGKIVTAPMEVAGGDRIAVCVDPQGTTFAVHSVRAVARAPEAARARPKTAPRRPKSKKRTARPKAKAKRAPAKRKTKRRR
ncbi:MAG TPA: VOC family protein [Gemmatimonadales bacterium]|nr:VOC family protein [Gemmatimonadales bacterium]